LVEGQTVGAQASTTPLQIVFGKFAIKMVVMGKETQLGEWNFHVFQKVEGKQKRVDISTFCQHCCPWHAVQDKS